MLSKTNRYDLQSHLTVYLLATVAILLLLYEQSQLSSLAGTQPNSIGGILMQQAVLGLLLALLLASFGQIRKRWAYTLSAILFAGYSGIRLTSAFSETLGLVPTLQARGIPISTYQGTFYLLALVAAVSYLSSILLLRRSCGRLSKIQRYNVNS